jgi:hypothetical protein
MRRRTRFLVGAAMIVAAGVWTARAWAQGETVLPCDATCVDTGGGPASCSTYISYTCSTCILYRYCPGFGLPGTQVCWDFAEEGLKIVHTLCANGSHTDEWFAAPCGACYG